MALKKCPRCELNYIKEDEDYCKVCKREMRGEQTREEPELCSVCNEAPALPGRDICLFCLKEMNARNADKEDVEDVPETVEDASLDIDPVSTMDEIIPEIEEDIPAREFDEIDHDLSLNQMSEEEDEDKDEDDDEET